MSTPPGTATARHFEAIYRDRALDYERLVSREDHEERLLPAIARARPLGDVAVVEVGAGSGRLTRLLAPHVRSIAAFDAAHAMLAVARDTLSRFAPAVRILAVADNRRLPVRTASADLAIGGWTFGHLTEWYPDTWKTELDRTLREFFRVLRPGGTAVVVETLGTGTETPAAPTPALAAFHEILETRHGFRREVIRTDYLFETPVEAADLLGLFFGDALAARAGAHGGCVVPECTGVWSVSPS